MKDQYDAIIVLGGGINEKGAIPPNVVLRVKESVQLLKENIAPRIIMSGRWGYNTKFTPPKTEATAMKWIAVALGVDPNAILTEESSADTLGNAYFCKKLFLEPNGWHNIMVLMADHHTGRSEYLFRKVLGPTYKITIHPVAVLLSNEERTAKAERHKRSLAIAHQWLDPIADGDDTTIWKLISTKHPGYTKNPEITKEELAKIFTSLQ